MTQDITEENRTMFEDKTSMESAMKSDEKPFDQFIFDEEQGYLPLNLEDYDVEPGTSRFIEAFQDMQEYVHAIAISKGWWDKERNDGEQIALMHSELSEALEALRRGDPLDDKIPDYTGAEAELADTIIRIMDFAQARNYCIAEAIAAKCQFNLSRERMHGKLF